MSTTPTAAPTDKAEALDLVMDIPVEITVELGSAEMSLREVMQLAPGSVVELNKKADEPVNLYVNRKLVAKGEIVLVANNLGIKITHVTGAVEDEAKAGM
jgi:flagellar motor switch protein FliN